jgi:hypothetical protein
VLETGKPCVTVLSLPLARPVPVPDKGWFLGFKPDSERYSVNRTQRPRLVTACRRVLVTDSWDFYTPVTGLNFKMPRIIILNAAAALAKAAVT